VLVFSQFTSMLALIEDALRARGIAYALLTGDTVDRAAPVAAFQRRDVGVFLISLKAGGVGLNLTAADTVIHYDPWWNPASENQATDRAWRIGQEQPVFVYKLIARGTLEEKIQEMQRRKGELANAVLEADAGLAAAIGPDDLRMLFAQP
jgi:SNF2 family DNA or RNA helicase